MKKIKVNYSTTFSEKSWQFTDKKKNMTAYICKWVWIKISKRLYNRYSINEQTAELILSCQSEFLISLTRNESIFGILEININSISSFVRQGWCQLLKLFLWDLLTNLSITKIKVLLPNKYLFFNITSFIVNSTTSIFQLFSVKHKYSTLCTENSRSKFR